MKENVKEENKIKDQKTVNKIVTEVYRNIYLVDDGAKTPPLGGTRELHCKNCFAGTDLTKVKLNKDDLILKSLEGIENIIARSDLWKQSDKK